MRIFHEAKRLTWEDFNNPSFKELEKTFLPRMGEGDNMMSQAITATCRLIYKYFNDGDVFDNVHSGLKGFGNDLSTEANWLVRYIPETQECLERVLEGVTQSEYKELLYDLMHIMMRDEVLVKYAEAPKQGSVYECSGPFEFDPDLVRRPRHRRF